MGDSTIEKIRHGKPALTNKNRPPQPKHPMFGFTLRGVENLWEHIVTFLWHIYHTEAEVMPNQYALPGKRSDETPFPEEGRDLDDDLRIITKFSRALETTYSDVDVNMIGPGTFRGLVRALPYGTRTELYFEYCAYTEARGLPCASQSTFLRVANTILKPGVREGHLRFRKINEHGQCDRCWHLKHAISCARTDEEKLNSRKAHHRHVLSQWLDSQQYASLQAMAHNFFEALFQESIRRLVMFTCLPTGRMFLFFGSLLRCTARHVKCVNFDSMFEGSAEFGRELQCTEFGSGWHGPSQVQSSSRPLPTKQNLPEAMEAFTARDRRPCSLMRGLVLRQRRRPKEGRCHAG